MFKKLELLDNIMLLILKLIVCATYLTLTFSASNKKIKPGTLFELQCPAVALKQITNMRTYALVLNNAQRNMQIKIFVKKQGAAKKYANQNKADLKQQQFGKIQYPDKNQLSLECVLNKDQKVCVLDGFINEISINCSSSGSISLLIVEPMMISSGDDEEVIKQRVIAPVLNQNQKGILVFRPNISIDLTHSSLEDIFISNCVERIDFFQHEFLLGVKGTNKIDIILTTDGIIGEWIFTRVNNIIIESSHVTQAYNLPGQLAVFEIEYEKEESETSTNFYGFKLLLCSENRSLIQNLSVTVTAVLKIENRLFSQEELNQTITIKSGDLNGKLPMKIAFFYEEHPLQKILLNFTSAIHYKLQLSEPRGRGERYQHVPPIFEQDEYFYYSYQLKKKSQVIKIEAHIVKSFQTKLTPTLRAVTEGVEKIVGIQKKESDQNSSGLIELVNDKVSPMKISNNNSYAEFLVHVEISGSKKLSLDSGQNQLEQQNDSMMSYFKLMLQTSFSLIQIQVGSVVNEFLFENQVKRFVILKQSMEKVVSKKLKVVCVSCHAFLTYKTDCTNINCCEYAHADQVQVKSASLMIIVVSSTHVVDTAIIQLQLYQDQKAFTLQDGQIVSGLLTNFDNYIFESDGKQEIQIMYNSQVQSILMLAIVTRDQFPTKNSFDYQSNQGYIRIPPTKMKGTIYITLLKTMTSFEFSLTNFKIPYSIVALTSKGYLNIKEGSQFSHILGRNAQKQYLLQHSCNSLQKLYFKIYPKSHTSLIGVNHDFSSPTLNIKIRLKDSQKILLQKNMSQHGLFEITDILKKGRQSVETSTQNTQSVCSIVVAIKNVLPETLSITSMFFKEKQIYQIYAGQFNRNQLLARKKLTLFCVVDPERETNIYAYSLLEEIMMKVKVISVRELKLMEIYSDYLENEEENGETQTDFLNEHFQILRQQDKKRSSHSQYIHLSPIKSLSSGVDHKEHNLMVLVIEISKNSQNSVFQRNDIYAICTQNQTVIRVGNRLHYQIRSGNSHNFLYPLSGQMILGDSQKNKQPNFFRNIMGNDKQIILQTTKLNGNYEVSVRLKYFGKVISNLSLFTKTESNSILKQQANSSKQEQPIVIIKTEAIRSKLNFFAKQGKEKEIQRIQFNNLYLEFEISCVKNTEKSCIFLTSLQTSQSDIRQLTLGVPEIFHINKHSSIIFIYNNNLYDSQFKFKVNRKLGFPNYKLCSFRPTLNRVQRLRNQQSNLGQHENQISSDLQAEDRCLTDLQNPENQLNLRIEQNAFNSDSKLIVGRTHELIINQYNEQYCTNCTYYLGLYSDYDIVEGSIFVMSANQETLLEEGSSITTIVYRGEPDKYALINWQSLMGIVYEIEGGVEVKVYYFDTKTKRKVIVLNKSSYKALSSLDTPSAQGQKITASSNNIITINLHQKSSTPPHHEYFVDIQPANNLPSALYTLVIMNKEEQVINIKDGVPYEMKYSLNSNQSQKQVLQLHPIIHYRYVCENQGIFMVSTKNFDDLEIQLTCRDHLSDVVEDNLKINDPPTKYRKSQRKGKPIDIKDLLKTKKLYKMSNRLDIMISPKICSKYQLTITTKTPSISYKVLVSSTDIVTLPMNKEVPGILKYQTKLYQIYEISVNEKTEVRCTFKFCQGGDGRIMIAKSKKNIYEEIYESQIQINQETTFETLKYTAKPGLFYIKLEFKASSGLMQYTIYVQKLVSKEQTEVNKESQKQSTANPLKIFKNMNTISYKVLRVGYDYTDYEINFYPIVQRTGIFQIEYYIVQSTKLKLLKKTQNCNGQYFEELVSHHDQIKQTKIVIAKQGTENKDKQNKQRENTRLNEFDGEKQKIKFRYSTTMSYSFITIIPIVYNKQTHEFYHMYIPKYHEVELTNGQIFSKVSYILSEVASRVEQIIDIHGSEYAIILIISIMFVLCILGTLLGGVWLGAKYFFKTKTVYVLKQIKQQDGQEEAENEDNGVQEQYVNNSATAIVSSLMRQPEERIQAQVRISQQQENGDKNIQIKKQEQNFNPKISQ